MQDEGEEGVLRWLKGGIHWDEERCRDSGCLWNNELHFRFDESEIPVKQQEACSSAKGDASASILQPYGG